MKALYAVKVTRELIAPNGIRVGSITEPVARELTGKAAADLIRELTAQPDVTRAWAIMERLER